jgi:hypothetical protein
MVQIGVAVWEQFEKIEPRGPHCWKVECNHCNATFVGNTTKCMNLLLILNHRQAGQAGTAVLLLPSTTDRFTIVSH